MKLILLIASVVLFILAAILGWNFGPHHCFALLSAGLACGFVAIVTPESLLNRV